MKRVEVDGPRREATDSCDTCGSIYSETDRSRNPKGGNVKVGPGEGELVHMYKAPGCLQPDGRRHDEQHLGLPSFLF